MLNLLDFLQPQAQAQPTMNPAPLPTNEAQAPSLADQWNSYLQDPNIRASLLSAGLAMMRPTWGGPGQAIVSGIGAGAETLGERQQMQQKMEMENEESASKKADKALDRSTALEIAKMNNDTRLSLGNMRGQGGGSGAGKNTQLGYFKELVKNNRDPLTGEFPEGITEDLLFERAGEMASQDRARAGVGNASVSGPQGATGAAPASPSGSTAPAEGAKTPRQTNGAVQGSKDLTPYKDDPRIQNLLKTPAGQKKLKDLGYKW